MWPHDVHLSQGDLRFEPPGALTDQRRRRTGLDSQNRGRCPHLVRGGWLLFEHGYDQASAARDILLKAGFPDPHLRKGFWPAFPEFLVAGSDKIHAIQRIEQP